MVCVCVVVFVCLCVLYTCVVCEVWRDVVWFVLSGLLLLYCLPVCFVFACVCMCVIVYNRVCAFRSRSIV